MIEWSVALQNHEGEAVCGDHYLVRAAADGYLVAAIDGIGHGPEAVLASRTAASVLEANAGRPLVSLFEICHRALYQTRGVVMSLASFHESKQTMMWLGVGNVQGRLLRSDKSSLPSQEELFLRGGVVGHNMPSTLDVNVTRVDKGDILILATDGVQGEFTEGVVPDRSPQQIANDILARNKNGTDDALVIVVRVQGGAS